MGKLIAGVDVGGTTIKVALFPMTGEPVCKFEIKTTVRDEEEFLWKDISSGLYAKLDELGIPRSDLAAVGMGIPGPIREDGYLSVLVNLGLFGSCYPAKELSKLMGGIPCVAGNDANCAAMGEFAEGAAKEYKSAVFFTIGTGVGGAIVLDGNVIAGAHGTGGELGHLVVNPDEPDACNCGNHGCLEQYASATGLVRTANRLLQTTDIPSVFRDGRKVSCKVVCQAAEEGDPLCMEVIDTFGKYMGLICAHMVLTVDPEVIIIGGGVSRSGKLLTDAIEKHLWKHASIVTEKTPVVIAKLGNDAGVYGAAELAKKLLK